jgi:uncharacterized membrane protein
MSDGQSNPTTQIDDSEKTYVLIVHGLYLASLMLGVTSIIGVVMAYVKRDNAQEWAASHYQYAIYTFWLGFLYTVISLVLCMVLIGFLMLFGVLIWFIIRSVIPITKALNQEPMDNPTTWWI